MAECPGCKGKLEWNWCHDTYMVDDKYCIETECIEVSDLNLGITVMQCPKCKTVLGTTVSGDHGGYVYNIKEFNDIEWEEKENSYDPFKHLCREV